MRRFLQPVLLLIAVLVPSPFAAPDAGLTSEVRILKGMPALYINGKLYFNEVDTETHLFRRQWRWGDSLRNPANFEETKGLLVCDHAYALIKGFGMWWTVLHGGTYHDDGIIGLFRQLKQLDEEFLSVDKRSNLNLTPNQSAILKIEESGK